MKVDNIMTETLDELAAVSFNAFLSLIPFYLNASAELTVICIYMFFIDFFLGVIDATKESKFSWRRFYSGIMKITSLFFAITIVGVGTYSLTLTFGSTVLGFETSLIFNFFIFLLITFQMQSINRHLARLGFQVNKFLDVFFTRLTSRLVSKVFRTIDKIAEDSADKDRHYD